MSRAESTPVSSISTAGPAAAYGATFFNEMQLWASRGYFVIFLQPARQLGPRPGLCRPLRQVRRHRLQKPDAVLPMCAWKKVPDIDKDNLCVTGGSYGGYMTNWIIGHTDRFRAACAQRSISDWIAYQGTSDLGSWFNMKEHGADIEHNIEAFAGKFPPSSTPPTPKRRPCLSMRTKITGWLYGPRLRNVSSRCAGTASTAASSCSGANTTACRGGGKPQAPRAP